jgi:hypothetical protein
MGKPVPSANGNGLLWSGVPADRIAQFLRAFLVHPQNHDFQGDAIADFLATATELSNWTIALPTGGNRGPVALSSGLSVDAKKRSVLLRPSPPQSLLVGGKNARVGGREDVLHGLSREQGQRVKAEQRETNPDLQNIPEDEFRAVMQSPLLVVHLLRGVVRKDKVETSYRQDLVLPALGLHFPGRRDPNAPKRYVSYRLNRVAQGELELDGDEPVDDDDEN